MTIRLLKRPTWILSAVGLCTILLAAQTRAEPVAPPQPYGPVPSPGQLRWHELEFYGLIHFGMNTFTDQEWGYGDTLPERFNPAAFDAAQIISTMKEAGMKGAVLVCKHHDGFCLWPSQYTDYSVKKSPWRNGQGDMVKEVSEACRKHGMKFGVYLSPWDRHHKDYGRSEYLTYYRHQLSELLTNYGEIFISWHDGARGGDGYYGGARETRNIDNRTYYDWPTTWALVRKLQPLTVIFSDAGPDVRWVGNERGFAGDPCWATTDLADSYPGMPSCRANEVGRRTGTNWVPAECDVSLRPWWFYHGRDNAQLKPVEQLVSTYFMTVGRGACLDLNVSPSPRGRIHDLDADILRELGRWLHATFDTDLAKAAHATSTNVRGGDQRFSAENLHDSDRNTYWTTDDEVTTPEVILDLGKPTIFNIVRIREYLPLGQRVEGFSLDTWQNGQWRECYRGTSIGSQRLVRVKPLLTDKVRLRITKAPVCPALSELGLFLEPRDPKRTNSPAWKAGGLAK